MSNLPVVQNNDIKSALMSIEQSHPAAFDVLAKVVSQNIIVLGENEAFALRDKSNGEIKAFRRRLVLSQSNGGLVCPAGNDFVISAQGYEMWQESAGACVVFPQNVLVGQEWRSNPYVERDPNNRRILSVHARAIAFRFSSIGIPQVSDWTTIFDTPSYRLIDLLAKAKKRPQAFKLLPAEMEPKDQPGTWASYPFDESTRLWINTEHEEALEWFSQIINREKKAMDFAQTFAKRNSLKHLSGLQKAPKGTNEWVISVLCWRPTSGNIIKWDATEYFNLQKRVANMIESGGGEEFDQIEYEAGKEAVSDETGFEALEAATDPEDQQTIDIKPDEEKPEISLSEPAKPDLTGDDLKAMNQYLETKRQFPEETARSFKQLGIDKVDTPEQARDVYETVKQMIDADL